MKMLGVGGKSKRSRQDVQEGKAAPGLHEDPDIVASVGKAERTAVGMIMILVPRFQ